MNKVIIPQSYFEKIRQIGWVEVLKKLKIKNKEVRGGSGTYKTRCVLHQEKKASLIFASESFFTCFGCGRAGDIFHFVSLVLAKDDSNPQRKTCRWFKKCFNIPLPWEDR